MAKLYFTHGPMGSQKSTDLIVTAYNYEEHGGHVLVAKPEVDVRGDSTIVSRTGLSRAVDFLITPEMDVEELMGEEVERRKSLGRPAISALLVDEAQFLDPKQADQLLGIVINLGIPVLAWGLRSDFRTHGFPGSDRLSQIAQVVRESITMCAHGDGCKHRAQFNARLIDGEYVREGGQVAILDEAGVAYRSLCARHYVENVGPIAAPAG